MGYLCPVCEEPFGSDAQCANHLAVTAIIHGDDHEAWLAETVADREADDWESVPREELAAIIAEAATETTDHDHPGDHTHPVGDGQPDGMGSGGGRSGGAGPAGGRSGGSPGGGGPVGGPGGVQDTHPATTDTDAAQLDADAQAILSEARELTERMQQRGPGGDEVADGSGNERSDESSNESDDKGKES